jgi:hypothetical protein
MYDEEVAKLFENPEIRKVDDLETGETYYSVLDTIKAITNCENPKRYWENIVDDGKLFGTDLTRNCKTFDVVSSERAITKMEFATKKHILRIISSIPSHKAEPYKQWLSKIAFEKISGYIDPEITIENAINDYRNLGFSEDWIAQKLRSAI